MKKSVKLIALCMALVLVFALAACGSSSTAATATETAAAETAAAEQTDSEYIIGKGTMIVGITDFAPMDYMENGEWTGFDAELGRLVGEKLGVSVEFIEIDWDNKQLELDSKALDCIWNGMTLTDEVAASMECTNTYVLNAQVVVTGAANAGVSSVEDMKEMSFAVESGSAGESAAESRGLNYTAVAAQSDALLEVASGSSDACIIDLTMANAMTGEGTSYPDLVTVDTLDPEEYTIGFRKGSDMAAKVNEILDELAADGTLQALADKYGLSLTETYSK